MNKKYIDFVPKKAGVGGGSVARKKTTQAKVILPGDDTMMTPMPEEVFSSVEQEELRIEEIFAEKPKPVEKKTSRKLGVIEDFSGKFVSKDVEKRPLSVTSGAFGIAGNAEAMASVAKSKKISRIPLIGEPRNKEAANEPVAVNEGASKEMAIPKQPFVNTEKIPKRPLSRNVYQPRKTIEEPKEETKGTITIIEKPERDSRIGLIVTIIITIILGAAAGTVAFLLLPK